MDRGDDHHTDPVLHLQSHPSLPPPPPPPAKDDAHPERDHTSTPHTSDNHVESLPTRPVNASEHQQSQQQEDRHPSAVLAQDASGASDPAQSYLSQQSTPTLPPMNFQHQPPAHTPAPIAAPAPAPAPAHASAPVHAQNGHIPQHQHQHHQPPPPQHHPHPPPAHNTNGTPTQYPPHGHAPPPPNYTYPSEAGMQQGLPGMQTNGGPVNGYAPHMGYQMPLGAPHMNTNQLPGTRHKKEIKRRTKTGCLTCRKRRIKCDEAHPHCRNCQKSKRECLGYDPIFKSQSSPQTIQPAPGTFPPPQPQQHQQQPPPQQQQQQHQQQHQVKQETQMGPEPQRYSNVPQGYMPAASAGYSPATAMQPSVDFGPQIDPALGPVNSAIAPPPVQPPPPAEEYTTSLHPQRNVRLVNMDSLYSLDNVPPAFPPHGSNPLPAHEIDMIRGMYLAEYAIGLDRFFETTWYTDHGFNQLLANHDLLHYFSHCVERFRQGQNGTNTHGLTSLEARLIWQLGCLPRAFHSNPPPQYIVVLLQRLAIVENLLCGTFLDSNMVPASPPASPPDPKLVEQYTQYLQDAFWHQLGRFVSIHDDVISPDAAQQIAAALAAMRNILSMLENRDVLYSMAIARHFGGRMVDYNEGKTLVSKSAEPDDPIAKLAVAMTFIRDEDSNGTTQVVQRLCGMCRRSWQLQRQTIPSA
ncbi:hypothetical protein D6C95_00714 [Aureobasidium pullulans]|nr:hypothetical protein D6C95_00714 [Aureobasidium pullulans]